MPTVPPGGWSKVRGGLAFSPPELEGEDDGLFFGQREAVSCPVIDPRDKLYAVKARVLGEVEACLQRGTPLRERKALCSRISNEMTDDFVQEVTDWCVSDIVPGVIDVKFQFKKKS